MKEGLFDPVSCLTHGARLLKLGMKCAKTPIAEGELSKSS